MNDDDDGDYTPESIVRKAKAKANAKAKKSISMVENLRGSLHILQEDHDQFLSTSFEGNRSFQVGLDPSSSQIDRGISYGDYDFDNNIFAGLGDDAGLDIVARLGDDLARELGEDWGAGGLNVSVTTPLCPTLHILICVTYFSMDMDNPLNIGPHGDLLNDFALDVPEIRSREGSIAATDKRRAS